MSCEWVTLHKGLVRHIDWSCAMNESYHTDEWGMSHEWVRSHIWMRHVTRMNETCHTYKWGMSHICMSHGAHMNESWRTYEWVMAHIWVSHASTCHTYKWGMSQRLYAFEGVTRLMHTQITRVPWRIYMCDRTHSHVWHDSFTCVPWLVHMGDMTHPHVWHPSLCADRTPVRLFPSKPSVDVALFLRFAAFVRPLFPFPLFHFEKPSFDVTLLLCSCQISIFSLFSSDFFFLFPLIPLAILWCYVAFLRLSNHSPYIYLRVCVCVCVCVYIYTFRYI